MISFFFDERLKNQLELSDLLKKGSAVEKLKIANYALQLGTFKSIEKNLYILGDYYDFIFEKTVSRLTKKKFTKEQLDILKPLILRSIIETKRGIPFDHGSVAFFFNGALYSLGMRIIPYIFGDSIHLSEGSIKFIKTFEELKEKKKPIFQKGFCSLKFKKIIETVFPYKPYIPYNDKSFPDWMNFSLKKGYLILNGAPYAEEVTKKYVIRICTKNQYNIIQIKLFISNVDQLEARAKNLRNWMLKNAKLTVPGKNNSLTNRTEEKKCFNVKVIELESLKSEEFNEVVDEKIEVKIVNK